MIRCAVCTNENPDDVTVCEICQCAIAVAPPVTASSAPAGPPALLRQPAILRMATPLQRQERVRGKINLLAISGEEDSRKKQIVYVPSGFDEDVDALIYNGAIRLAQKAYSSTDAAMYEAEKDVVQVGAQCLDALRNGGRLFVVGHGNAGGGIGTHDRYFGAKSLVKCLVQDRLPKKPKEPVTIWLYACVTGTAVNLKYIPIPFFRKDPYVLRFAKDLAKNGFSNYYCVGFAGFVNPVSGLICKSYHFSEADKRKWEKMTADERVIYKVDLGRYQKISGATWVQSTRPYIRANRLPGARLDVRRG